MRVSLEEELKAFEKDLSVLLVRFMKICDAVEAAGGSTPPKPEMPTTKLPPRTPTTDFSRAYT